MLKQAEKRRRLCCWLILSSLFVACAPARTNPDALAKRQRAAVDLGPRTTAPGSSVDPTRASHEDLLARCDEGHGASCRLASQRLGARQVTDSSLSDQVRALLALGCLGRDPESCYDLARTRSDHVSDSVIAAIRSPLESACGLGHARACTEIAQTAANGPHADSVLAQAFAGRGCILGATEACTIDASLGKARHGVKRVHWFAAGSDRELLAKAWFGAGAGEVFLQAGDDLCLLDLVNERCAAKVTVPPGQYAQKADGKWLSLQGDEVLDVQSQHRARIGTVAGDYLVGPLAHGTRVLRVTARYPGVSNVVELWSIAPAQRISGRYWLNSTFRHAHASDDGSLLAIQTDSGVEVLRSPDLTRIAQLDGHAVALRGDGRVLIVSDEKASRWFHIDGNRITEVRTDRPYGWAVFRRDGKRLLVSAEKQLRVIDSESGAELASLPSNNPFPLSFAGPESALFDGNRIILAWGFGVIRVDLEGEPTHTEELPNVAALDGLRTPQPPAHPVESYSDRPIIPEEAPKGSVTGVVVHGNRPAPGVSVWLSQRETLPFAGDLSFHTKTNLQGEFSFARVPAREWVIYAHDDAPFLEARGRVELGAPPHRSNVRMRLVEKNGLTGVVHDADGTPLPDVRIAISDARGRAVTQTDAAGRYAIEIQGDWATMQYQAPSGLSGFMDLSKVAGTVREDIILPAVEDPRVCRVRVTSKTGKPMPNIPVRPTVGPHASRGYITNKDGVVAIESHECAFEVANTEHTPERTAPHHGEQHVLLPSAVLKFESTPDLSISLVELPEPEQSVRKRTCDGREYLPGGGDYPRCLPRGHYRAEYCNKLGMRGVQEIDLVDDEIRVVPMPRLEPGLVLQGKVIDAATGDPIVDAAITTVHEWQNGRARTGARGHFRLGGLAAKTYDLTIATKDASRIVSVDLDRGAPPLLVIEITAGVHLEDYPAVPFTLGRGKDRLRIVEVGPFEPASRTFAVGDLIDEVNGLRGDDLSTASVYNSLREVRESKIRFWRGDVRHEVTISSGVPGR